MTKFYNQFFCEERKEYSVYIEDNSRVAYAYLFKGNDIIGDVWLYNQAPTPQVTKWTKEDMFFLNPQEYVKDQIGPLRNENEVELKWELSANSIDNVLIYLKGGVIVKLTFGSTPGWSTAVSKDGPLAKKLSLKNLS